MQLNQCNKFDPILSRQPCLKASEILLNRGMIFYQRVFVNFLREALLDYSLFYESY